MVAPRRLVCGHALFAPPLVCDPAYRDHPAQQDRIGEALANFLRKILIAPVVHGDMRNIDRRRGRPASSRRRKEGDSIRRGASRLIPICSKASTTSSGEASSRARSPTASENEVSSC